MFRGLYGPANLHGCAEFSYQDTCSFTAVRLDAYPTMASMPVDVYD